MGWFIMRTKEGKTELYTDCNVYLIGRWSESGLPHIYNKRRDAVFRMHMEQEKDPSYSYEVNEFLR